MNRSLVGALVLAAACLAVGFLVGRRDVEAPGETRTYAESLTSTLALRPEQVSALERVLAAEDAALRSMVDESRAALAAPIAARRRQTEDEILALLDDVQRAEYARLTQR